MQESKRGLFDTGVLLKFFLGEKDKEIVRKLLDKVVLKEIEGFKPNTFLDRLKE